MVFTTAYIMVGKYFAKNKGKAMGFALLGCGLGNIAFAHITNLTLHSYGYWGSMLILGAIQLNHAISGALYRPLEIQVTKEPIQMHTCQYLCILLCRFISLVNKRTFSNPICLFFIPKGLMMLFYLDFAVSGNVFLAYDDKYRYWQSTSLVQMFLSV